MTLVMGISTSAMMCNLHVNMITCSIENNIVVDNEVHLPSETSWHVQMAKFCYQNSFWLL